MTGEKARRSFFAHFSMVLTNSNGVGLIMGEMRQFPYT